MVLTVFSIDHPQHNELLKQHFIGTLILTCGVNLYSLQSAVSMLKQDFKEGEMSLASALALAVKVLNKTMDVSKLSAEKGQCPTSLSSWWAGEKEDLMWAWVMGGCGLSKEQGGV